MNVVSVNENSVMIYCGDTINETTSEKVARVYHHVKQYFSRDITDVIASYHSVLIVFNLAKISHKTFVSQLNDSLHAISQQNLEKLDGKLIKIPVYYGDEVALDKEEVCKHFQCDFPEIIRRHCEPVYRVYAIGFTLGFAYLGQTQLEISRKTTPRLSVPAGSVGLADRQTAVYPKSSPGGWQIIGNSPLKLVDFNLECLTIFEVGDRVQFEPIDRQVFLEMGGIISTKREILY